MGRKDIYINMLPVVDVETYSNTCSVFNLLLLPRIVYTFLKSRSHYLGEVRRWSDLSVDNWLLGLIFLIALSQATYYSHLNPVVKILFSPFHDSSCKA